MNLQSDTNSQNVALYVETSSKYGRQLLWGILKFVRNRNDVNWL